MRGYYVRRFKMPRKRQMHKIAKTIALKKIEEFIEVRKRFVLIFFNLFGLIKHLMEYIGIINTFRINF